MSSSPLQRTHDIMSALAGLADRMDLALRKSDLDKIARLKVENVTLRKELTEAKETLAGFRPASDAEARMMQSLRPLAQRIAKGDETFKFWIQDYHTISSHGERTVSNALQNTRYFSEAWSGEELAGVAAGRPAVIVSAGPSLDKQWELLKQHRDSFVLLTMNRCIDGLIRHGIVPDFVVVTDPKEAISHHLTQVSPETVPHLLIRASAHPKVWAANAGRKYYFTDGSKHEVGLLKSVDCDVPMHLAGMSAAHCCLRLAKAIGCSVAILVGQDLAYTNDRLYSETDADAITIEPIADGSVAVCQGKKRGEENDGNATILLKVPGYYGGEVATDPSMAKMIAYFESLLADSLKDYRVINATEGGARIQGTEQLPFQEALDTFCQESFMPFAEKDMVKARVGQRDGAAIGKVPARELLAKVSKVHRLTATSIKALKTEPNSMSFRNKLIRMCDQVYAAYNEVSFLLSTMMLKKQLQQEAQRSEPLEGVAKVRAEHMAIRYAAGQAITFLKESLGEV